ncbi:MAG: hypothetical protein R3C58_05715 [Parvularculaceae bacterium]
MTENALDLSNDDAPKTVRVPVLPGRQNGGAPVDTGGAAYQAGVAAAAAEFAGREAQIASAHEEFVREAGEMLAEMDARYRRECFSLIERLFSAIAPTLARNSSLIDIMEIVDQRVLRSHTALTMRAHPSLIAHLPEADQRRLSEAPEITLKSDETCAPAMIDVQWEKGGLFHDPDGLIADILRELGESGAAPEEKTQ